VLFATVAAAACIRAGGASAQTQEAATQGPQNDELTEVIVTAERRAADQQQTPISMTVESGEDLLKDHIFQITDLQQIAPNFSVNTTGDYNSINIRGIGNTAVNPAITPGVAVARDGLIAAEIVSLNEPFYDIADVEVLKGPQGTFIGQSSTGGALLINSHNPTFDGVNGYVNALVGNFTDTRVDGAINLPVNNVFAARIAFNWEHRNSFYFDEGSALTVDGNAPLNDPGHIDDENVRISLLFKPTDQFQALLKIENNHASTGGSPDYPDQNTYTDPSTGAVEHSPFYAYSTHQPFLLNEDVPGLESIEVNDRVGLEMKYTLPDDITIRSLTGFQHIDIEEVIDYDATSANAQIGHTIIGPDDNYYQQELDVISPEKGPLTWIAGAAWFYRDTPVYQYNVTFNPPYQLAFPLSGTQVQEAPGNLQQLAIHDVQRTSGLFGQVSYQIIDPLQLQVGVRENWDNNFYKGGIELTFPPGSPFFVGLPGTFSDSVPTWKVGLNYNLTPDEFIYGFVARGYKSGGVNAGAPIGFAAEHVTDWELGIKSTFFDRHIETQLGGYYMNYEGLQEPIIDALSGAGGVTNVGNSKVDGIEASLQAHLSGFNVNLGATYNRSKLGEATLVAGYRLPGTYAGNSPQCAPGQTTGCFNYYPYIQSVNGSTLPFSPEFTFDAAVDYGIAVGGNGVVRPRLTFSHVAKQYASLFQTDSYFLLPSRDLLGASLGYESGPWVAELYGRNLANKTYIQGYYETGTTSNVLQYYGAPRQIGAQVTRSF
jgi:iron complex outermembrane receptor protein